MMGLKNRGPDYLYSSVGPYTCSVQLMYKFSVFTSLLFVLGTDNSSCTYTEVYHTVLVLFINYYDSCFVFVTSKQIKPFFFSAVNPQLLIPGKKQCSDIYLFYLS